MINRIVLHVDFNSYFATVEQQANPRLRGKPIGVTGGDRMTRTVIGAASIEAKKLGIKTGMQIVEAQRIYPQLILVKGDSDKYLETTKRFLNILKAYTPFLEVFSIDECFLELPVNTSWEKALEVGEQIKLRIRQEIGEWISCSVGISYNKVLAKLAGSLFKPNGLALIADEQAAQWVLDRVPLDEICGLGGRTKQKLANLGITSFPTLRKVDQRLLLLHFKSYGQFLYNIARGIDNTPITPFFDKEEIKSVGHRHTLAYDTHDKEQIKQLLLKLTELIARRLRAKKLMGKTIHLYFRNQINWQTSTHFEGEGMQLGIPLTDDGFEIFKGAWKIFNRLWQGQSLRLVGVTITNLQSTLPRTLSFLDETLRQEKIIKALDKINDRYGEFTLERGILLGSQKMKRKPNPYLSDRRFKI